MKAQIKTVATGPKTPMYPEAIVGEHIRQMELKYDLLQYEVDGWCVWPVLRCSVAMALTNLPLVKMNKLGWDKLLPIIIKDLAGLVWLPRSRHVVAVYASNRSELEGNLYKDIFFDILLQDIEDYFKIEHVDNKIFIPSGKCALIKSDLTSTAFKVLAQALARTGGPSYISSIAKNLNLCLEQALGLDTFTPQRISHILRRFYWSKKLYSWLLGRLQAEYLLLVTAYSDHAFVAAAKERAIEVIEFQHGSLDRYHTGYSWSTYAVPYKSKMPVPDRIFLFGEYWQRELETDGFWRKELRPVGSLRIDQYRQHKATRPADVFTIILTTQGIDTERLISFMAEFLKIANGHLDFRLFIKLHPAERSKDLYEAAFSADEHVCVLLSQEAPSTFDLLVQAHIHISIYSTCHYEALGLGLPTVILPLTSHQMVLHLHESGQAFLAQTPQDLLDIVLRWKKYKLPHEVGAFYFETNALINMKRELGI